MPLDLRHVESFVAVAETLSFSTAALRTNTVQSAISTHVKELERQVGRRLVNRGRGRAVTLTAEGAAFLVQARRLLMFADQIVKYPDGSIEADPLRLGTTVTFALSVIPSALRTFAADCNGVPVVVRTARSHELMDLLEDGQIDVAVVFDQGAHPLRRSTIQAHLGWATSERFVLSPNAPLPLAFLDDARDLRRHAFGALDDAGLSASLSTHPDPVGLRAVVSAGHAVTVMPKIAIVAPLMECEGRLGLPTLGTLPVSVYAGADGHNDKLERFTQVLTAHLEDAG